MCDFVTVYIFEVKKLLTLHVGRRNIELRYCVLQIFYQFLKHCMLSGGTQPRFVCLSEWENKNNLNLVSPPEEIEPKASALIVSR